MNREGRWIFGGLAINGLFVEARVGWVIFLWGYCNFIIGLFVVTYDKVENYDVVIALICIG